MHLRTTSTYCPLELWDKYSFLISSVARNLLKRVGKYQDQSTILVHHFVRERNCLKEVGLLGEGGVVPLGRVS